MLHHHSIHTCFNNLVVLNFEMNLSNSKMKPKTTKIEHCVKTHVFFPGKKQRLTHLADSITKGC